MASPSHLNQISRTDGKKAGVRATIQQIHKLIFGERLIWIAAGLFPLRHQVNQINAAMIRMSLNHIQQMFNQTEIATHTKILLK
ncbi:hypothetical protein TX23_01260 [Pseudomonas paralactis]|uniref:Transposase n=1 Tax=Pseudomonas paralactis TaxID=1615673 RepID=A0A0R3API2_9PSED|nr:hypothetical protein TX23_01260 [Pseudomonas paralactis]